MYAEPNSTNACAALSISNTSTSNIIENLYSSGGNAGNAGAGYAVGVYGSGNTLKNLVIDASRQRAILLDAGQQNTFLDCELAQVATNVVDVDITTGVLTSALFDSHVQIWFTYFARQTI
jgi:hypothetical protein